MFISLRSLHKTALFASFNSWANCGQERLVTSRWQSGNQTQTLYFNSVGRWWFISQEWKSQWHLHRGVDIRAGFWRMNRSSPSRKQRRGIRKFQTESKWEKHEQWSRGTKWSCVQKELWVVSSVWLEHKVEEWGMGHDFRNEVAEGKGISSWRLLNVRPRS